jgi:DNA repair protein RadC
MEDVGGRKIWKLGIIVVDMKNSARVDRARESFTINSLPETERPRERLQQLGAEQLSAQELLAIVMGSGFRGESVLKSAQRLMDAFKDIQGLADASLEELMEIHGIGPAKATQIKAAFELANRWGKASNRKSNPVIKTPEEAYEELKGLARNRKKEYFWAILLDTRNRRIKTLPISVGSLDASIVHPRELLKEAISASAASIIVAHNHPSGNPEPSQDDIKLSKRLIEAGNIVGIEIVDHIVIGDGKFVSLKREGLI